MNLSPVRLVTDAGALALTLRAPEGGDRTRTLAGNGWRHDFDIVLTASGTSRLVHDEQGRWHRFEPVEPDDASTDADVENRYRATRAADGELRATGDRYEWRRDDGTRVHFGGSVPTRVESVTGKVRALHYLEGRLRAVSGADRPTLLFAYESGTLESISLPDGTRWKIVRDGAGGPVPVRDDVTGECAPLPSDRDPDRDSAAEQEGDDERPPARDEAPCDSATSPPPARFLNGPGVPGALRLDARPASCRSYFSDFVGTARGAAIEIGLGDILHYGGYTATVRSFPIADFIGEELRVVRSRDLSLPTYDAREDGLLERLLRDGEEIEQRLLDPLERAGRLELRELGRTTTLLHDPDRPVVLELIVRHGLASPDQIRQVARARALLAERHGIVLRVIEIP